MQHAQKKEPDENEISDTADRISEMRAYTFEMALKSLHRPNKSLLLHLLLGLLRKVRVDSIRRPTALVDRPHDQRLASAAVTRRKHTFGIGAVVAVRCVDVLTLDIDR